MSALILIKLRELPEFGSIIEAIKTHRPIVPRYYPAATPEQQSVAMEKIKFEMARQEGFDHLVNLLEGKIKFSQGDK